MKVHVIDMSAELFADQRHYDYETDQWHVPRTGDTVVMGTEDEPRTREVAKVVWHLEPDPEVQVFVR